MTLRSKERLLKLIVYGVFAMIFIGVVIGQNKPPQLSADSRISLLKLQLKQKNLESQFLQIQQQLNRIQTEYTEGGKALQEAIDAAYKDAKLDKKEWTLSLETLEFTKIPVPKKEEQKKP